MGEHHFGVGSGRIKATAGERIDRIARKHGATFTSTSIPGDGPRYWFSCRSYGATFDGQTERAVWAALEAAKLAVDGRLAPSVFRKA